MRASSAVAPRFAFSNFTCKSKSRSQTLKVETFVGENSKNFSFSAFSPGERKKEKRRRMFRRANGRKIPSTAAAPKNSSSNNFIYITKGMDTLDLCAMLWKWTKKHTNTEIFFKFFSFRGHKNAVARYTALLYSFKINIITTDCTEARRQRSFCVHTFFSSEVRGRRRGERENVWKRNSANVWN